MSGSERLSFTNGGAKPRQDVIRIRKQQAGRKNPACGHILAVVPHTKGRAMMGFRCIPMDTESAIRFRQTGSDDAGNLLHRKIADHPSPCRHCLAEAEIGTPVLLGSYHFGRPHGVYWTPSPIFLHAESCERFERAAFVPEIVRRRLVSVRAYDADDMCIYDLGDVCDGTDVERLVERALVDHRTDYLNIHTARPGCFLCRRGGLTSALISRGGEGPSRKRGSSQCCWEALPHIGQMDPVAEPLAFVETVASCW